MWNGLPTMVATTPTEGCSIVYMLPVGWLQQWVIGFIVLGFRIAVSWRRPA